MREVTSSNFWKISIAEQSSMTITIYILSVEIKWLISVFRRHTGRHVLSFLVISRGYHHIV